MKYQFLLSLIVDASSEEEAASRAENCLENLKDTAGHAPYSCRLSLTEVCAELDDDDYDEDE